MNEFEKSKLQQTEQPPNPAPLGAQNPYPASIEKMSEKWREIQQQSRFDEDQKPRNFVERNYLPLGIGIALLIIALLVVFGGLAFLVLRAH